MNIAAIIALLALTAGAAPAAPKAKTPPSPAPVEQAPVVTDGAGPKRRTIALDPKRARAVYKVNAAPGLATVIELPEPWVTPPTCGDCVFGDTKPESQLWRLDVFPDTRSLSIKPTRLPGGDMPPSAFVTNIDIALEGGLAVTLFIELSVPERADARIEFTLPDDEKGDAKLTKRERELADRFEERVKDAAHERMLSASMRGTTCKDFWGRPNRSDNVVVRLKQLCRNAAIVYVTFEVENRRRADLFLASATLESTKQNPSAGEKLEKNQLRFNERGLGIAAIVAGEKDGGPERYRFTVAADGVDEETKIVIEDIEF